MRTDRIGRLHVLTDSRPGRRPLETVSAALAGGAPTVQVRVKGGTDRERYDFACRVVALCAPYGATCLVNDRADLVIAAGAAGVHLGEHDLPVEAVRRVVGAAPVVGGTARDSSRAAALVAAGASYVGVGPAYATSTKDGLPRPLAAAGIAAVSRGIDAPVIAIGGVTAARVPELLAAGASGVAVVSAISDAADPQAATVELLRALGELP